jgi:hypothetical protein
MMADLPVTSLLDRGRVYLGHRIRPGCRFFAFDNEEPVVADRHLTAFRTTKHLGEQSGTWQVTVATKPLLHDHLRAFEVVPWHERVAPGDWALLDASDGTAEWPIMLGIVDRVHRSKKGPVTTYTISGRDHGKVFDSEIVILPQYVSDRAIDLTKATGPFYRGLDAILQESGRDGLSPAELIERLALFFLGSVTRGTSGAAPIFHTPRSLRLQSSTGFVDLEAAGLPVELGLPIGELLAFAMDKTTTGRAVLRELFEGLPDSVRLWDYLSSWANTEMNELYVDFLPRRVLAGGVPKADDYSYTNKAGQHPFLPAVVLRRRPFPQGAQASSLVFGFGADPVEPPGAPLWRALPSTTVDEAQLVTDETSRADADRFNLYLATPHSSYGASKWTLALGAAGRGRLPIITDDSAPRYGWRSRFMSSQFLPTDPRVPNATYYRWSRMLADWNERNPEHWTGDLEHSVMLPGVRVGERLNVRRDQGTRTESYYLEGVTHAWQSIGQAKATSSSSFVVTRGSEDELGGWRP